MAKKSKRKRAAQDEAVSGIAAVGETRLAWGGDWIGGVVLVAAIAVAYLPVWWAGYIWDDEQVVTENRAVIEPLGLMKIWTTHAADICPFTLTTFWCEHALWGIAPLPYHLVNVVLHAAAAIVLWRVLLALRVPGAWFGAALWALHPVLVESVAWITEMKNTESGLFFLLSIFFFLRHLAAKADGRVSGSKWAYALTLLFAALAMASKTSTLTLPIILCLCAWWREGRWHWRNAVKVAPVFIMSLAAGLLSMSTQGRQLDIFIGLPAARTWPERLATAGDTVWFYLQKLVWPHPLIVVYPRWEIDAASVVAYLPLLAVIAGMLFLWLKRGSWARACFFAFACFLAALFPVMGLVEMIYFVHSFVADHFQYLAAMGPLALAGAGLAWLANRSFPARPWLHAVLGGAILVVLGVVTWQRTWVFQNSNALWTDTLAKNPSTWVGHYNLGYDYMGEGRLPEAIDQFNQALAYKPVYPEAECEVGNTLMQEGRFDEANAHFQKALEIAPDFAGVHNNLGELSLRKGQVDAAIVEIRRAVEINPYYAKAHSNLGHAYAEKGQIDDAISEFQKAIEIEPNLAGMHNNLGTALSQKGEMDAAIAEYRKALDLDPKYVRGHDNFGILLLKMRKTDEAIAQFQDALQLAPQDAIAQKYLAQARAGATATPAVRN